MVGCRFRNVKKVEESVALKELRLNTLRFMQRLICRDGEKGENHSILCVLAMKAWLGLERYGGTEKDMKQCNGLACGMYALLGTGMKTAQKSKTLSTDIEGWEKGVARTNVFGVPLEVTVLRQDSTKPVPFILVKFAVFLVLSGLKLKTKVQSLLYNHTLTRTMVEYASAVYTADSTELFTWTCSRCDGLTKINIINRGPRKPREDLAILSQGFEVIELIVDVQNCLQAFVEVADDLNAIVIAFRGTQETRIGLRIYSGSISSRHNNESLI
ncbi:probable feruloyl esterase A isoform X1 [Tanacetum coccineum]